MAQTVCRQDAFRRAMWGMVRETQRSPAGKFDPPKAGFPRILDVVAIGSWYHYQVANRAMHGLASTSGNSGHRSLISAAHGAGRFGVIGWEASDRLRKDLAITALKRAIFIRQPPTGLIHHSDRGSQYGSYDYRRLVAQMVCSLP